MKAIVKETDGPGGLAWRDWPEPELRAGHVVVAIEKAGICSTDVAIADGTYDGRHPLLIPTVLGHEAAGTVIEAAPDVTDVRVGQRVSLQVIWARPHAWQSILGNENLDPDWLHIGGSELGGAFAERIAMPADRLVLLPDAVDWEQGALLEPLAVAAHAMELVALQPAETFVLVGPGPFGLLMCQIARTAGAARIVVIGLAGTDEPRLDVARHIGADSTLTHRGDVEATCAEISEATPAAADVVIDCGGTPESTFIALEAAGPGARVGVFGFTREARIEPFRQLIRKGLTVRGVSAAKRRHYGLALRFVESGTIDPRTIVSHRLRVEKISRGIELVKSRRASKVLLDVS